MNESNNKSKAVVFRGIEAVVVAVNIAFAFSVFVACIAAMVFLASKESSGDDIFRPTGRYAKSSARQWYLVSEPWCNLCPGAKAKFLAKGWPEANIISSAEAHERFGISVRNVPYEFPEPEQQPVEAAAVETKPVKLESGPARHVYFTPRNMRRGLFSRCR